MCRPHIQASQEQKMMISGVLEKKAAQSLENAPLSPYFLWLMPSGKQEYGVRQATADSRTKSNH